MAGNTGSSRTNDKNEVNWALHVCGIAGFVNLDGAPADPGVLGAMTDMVGHRGRDDRGTRCLSLGGGVPDTALGFQRLKILDLSDRGHQPMTSPDGSIALLFNGAIYNAFDFKAELESKGYRFHSATDTEILLALYELLGLERMLERVDGMFAIVVADVRRGAVHLIRDPLGIKPLYWTQCGTTLLFASEAKAFLAHPAFRPEIDQNGIDELLAFRYIAGHTTLLKGVRLVQPGHHVTITPHGVSETHYWRIPEYAEKQQLSREDTVDRLEQLLDHSVRSQLLTDVPVGCQLSGGVDSSLVTLAASRHQTRPLHTFSIVFNEPRFSEEPWIRTASAAASAVSHRFTFDEPAFITALDAATWHMDHPVSHPNALALWWLGRRAHQDATVLLTGEGADELFAGYARFSTAAADVGAFIRATQFHSEGRLSKLRPSADLRQAIDKRHAIFEEGRVDHLSNCVRYELRTHLADLLIRQDKMAMAHGVETRVPFLSRDLIEYARALPGEHLAGSSGTKIVVKELATRRFDPAFVDRRKSTFNLPLAQYFRSRRFVEVMEDRLLPRMASRGLVNADVVRRWWRRALSAPSTTEGFWAPVALELWAQQVIDRPPSASAALRET